MGPVSKVADPGQYLAIDIADSGLCDPARTGVAGVQVCFAATGARSFWRTYREMRACLFAPITMVLLQDGGSCTTPGMAATAIIPEDWPLILDGRIGAGFCLRRLI